MLRLLRFAAVLVGTVCVPSIALAQAAISGVVRDTSGAVLPGVTVEAASPVLIEKVRTAVTDNNGRYQMIDLRPGAYTVTFTLAGFNTAKRAGVALSGSAASVVDIDLRVGSLEETITVTGEAPTVDVSTTSRSAVLSADTIDALPTSRNYASLARMIPAAVFNGTDVGGIACREGRAHRRAADLAQLRQAGPDDSGRGLQRHRRRRLGFAGHGRERPDSRQPPAGPARDAERHQHHDAAGGRQHRWP